MQSKPVTKVLEELNQKGLLIVSSDDCEGPEADFVSLTSVQEVKAHMDNNIKEENHNTLHFCGKQFKWEFYGDRWQTFFLLIGFDANERKEILDYYGKKKSKKRARSNDSDKEHSDNGSDSDDNDDNSQEQYKENGSDDDTEDEHNNKKEGDDKEPRLKKLKVSPLDE
jgi:hypothetical protein